MSDPPPILQYASPTRRLPIHLALFLVFWTILDFIAGILFILGGIGSCIFGSDLDDRLTALPFIILGPVLFTWSIVTLLLAIRVFKGDFAALLRACRFTLIAEILTWPIALLLYANFARRDEAFDLSNSARFRGWCIGLAVILLFPLALTVTRIVLRRAARCFNSADPFPAP